MSHKIIAIVGGGQAAAMAAVALRQQGFNGELHLFSDEPYLPYERPPLSKAMLLDENPQRQPILNADWWLENNVQLHLGVTLRQIDRTSRTLMLADGQSYRWSQLLLATGAAARPLPLLDKLGERCFTLRHAKDAERLRGALLPGKSIVIVGAGTIGTELAASAIQRGCRVTLVELASTVMGRNAPAPVRDYLLNRHRQAGGGCCSTAPLSTLKRESFSRLPCKTARRYRPMRWFMASVSWRMMRWLAKRAGDG